MRSFLIALLVLTLFGASSAWSQSTEESRAKAAEQAGRLREALAAYTTALQRTAEGSGDEQRLIESIIGLSKRISPPPSIPEDARRFSVRAHVWVKEAKSPSDFEEAAKEFAKALRIAPWWSDGYLNQGVVLEKAGKYDAAVRSFKTYLLASPTAADADKVRDQIYAIEVRKEMAARDRTAAAQEQQRKKQQEEASANDPARLAGEWCLDARYCGWDIKVNGNDVEFFSRYTDSAGTSYRAVYRGRISGRRIAGSFIVLYDSGCGWQRLPMEASISADWSRISISHEEAVRANGCALQTSTQELTFVRK